MPPINFQELYERYRCLYIWYHFNTLFERVSVIPLLIFVLVFPLALAGARWWKFRRLSVWLITLIQTLLFLALTTGLPDVYGGLTAGYAQHEVDRFFLMELSIVVNVLGAYWTMYFLKEYRWIGRCVVLFVCFSNMNYCMKVG